MKSVFVVVLSFNTNQETHDFLASMEKIKKRSFQMSIVIIDNNSKDQFELKTSEKKDSIHLIRTEENKGFAGGNNIGIRYALQNGADYIMVINNDTFVDSMFIENLLKEIDIDKKIGVVSPKIYFAKGHEFHKDKYKKYELGKVFWYAGGFEDWANVMSMHRGVDEVDHGQYDKVEKITFASGCCMLFKREVLEKVGLFDEKFFLYFEDADLNERIQKAGYNILYVPSSVIWHINAGSTGGSGSNLQDYFQTRNRMIFGIKYAPLRSKIALIRESMRFLVSGRPMQKKGIKDFYLGRFGKGSYFKN